MQEMLKPENNCSCMHSHSSGRISNLTRVLNYLQIRALEIGLMAKHRKLCLAALMWWFIFDSRPPPNYQHLWLFIMNKDVTLRLYLIKMGSLKIYIYQRRYSGHCYQGLEFFQFQKITLSSCLHCNMFILCISEPFLFSSGQKKAELHTLEYRNMY